MKTHTTFAMVKPDAVRANQTGAILTVIEEAGFCIKAMTMVQLTPAMAECFYAVHAHRPFYKDLCNFMTSGPVVAMVLEKKQAVPAFRTLIGATNPAEAREGTIRKMFARSIDHNAIHGSDSEETASKECAFFFPGCILL